MKTYEIDLYDDPYDRWQNVDMKAVRKLVAAAHEELDAIYHGWQLQLALRAAAVIGFTYRRHEFIQEIDGIADRAGITREQLLLLNLSYDLGSCSVDLPGMNGCTGALFHSPEHNSVCIARTMDWAFPSSIIKHSTLYRFKAGSRETLSVGFPGFVGVVSGMTNTGLAITLNQAFLAQVPNIAMPVPWLVRYALEVCDTHNEAVRCSRKHPPRQVVFTWSPTGPRALSLRALGANTATPMLRNEPLVIANHFLDDEAPEEREWGDSFERYATLDKAIRAQARRRLCAWSPSSTATQHTS
jgi:predicted choloylglycine hydrolase